MMGIIRVKDVSKVSVSTLEENKKAAGRPPPECPGNQSRPAGRFFLKILELPWQYRKFPKPPTVIINPSCDNSIVGYRDNPQSRQNEYNNADVPVLRWDWTYSFAVPHYWYQTWPPLHSVFVFSNQPQSSGSLFQTPKYLRIVSWLRKSPIQQTGKDF